MSVMNTAKQIKIFDILFYTYLLSLARQFMWIVPNNMLAWVCSAILALLFWVVYLAARVKFLPYRSKTEPWFYLLFIIAFIFFISMVIYPERSFDTVRMRFYYQEIGLLRYPFSLDYDHYLTNIIGEMINGLFRKMFGLRMGLLINFIVIVWTIYEIKEILSQYFKNKIVLILALLFSLYGSVLISQGLGTYFVDFHAIPLVMLAFRLIISKENDDNPYKLFFLSFLLGFIFAIKYSNLAFAAPLGLVGLFNQRHLIIKKPWILLSFFVFLLPNLPFMLLATMVFKSPLFPLYNNIFQSPYAPLAAWKDTRWGPSGILEVLLWPFKILLQTKVPFGEIHLTRLYSGQLTLGYFFGLISLPYIIYIKRWDILKMIVVILIGIAFWSFSTGYSRYMLSLEYLSVVFLFVLLSIQRNDIFLKILKVVLIILLCVSFTISITSYLSSKYMTWNGTHINNDNFAKLSTDYHLFFNDRNLRSFMDKEDLDKIDSVERWFHFSYVYAPLFSSKPEYILPHINRDKFFEDKIGKVFSSLVQAEDLPNFIDFANKYKLTITNIDKIAMNYFSKQIVLEMLLIKFAPTDHSNEYDIGSIQNMITTVPLELGEIIGNDSQKLLFYNFRLSEISFRWNLSKISYIIFTLDSNNAIGKLTLDFSTYGKQSIKILLNGTIIANLPNAQYDSKQVIKFDKKLLNVGTNKITFELPDIILDPPGVGLALRTLTIE